MLYALLMLVGLALVVGLLYPILGSDKGRRGVLLALRSQAAVTVVAGAGAIFYLGYWLVLAA